MDRRECVEKVIEICMDVFDNEEIILNELSCREEIKEWDSLAQLSIISDIEDEFDISFSLDEITGIKKIGELVDCVLKRVK